MPLLNYTTKVPASRTINEIQKMLATAGARQVLTEFGPGGSPVGVAFAIQTPNGERNYHLPADVAAVAQVMKHDDTPAHLCKPEQAERVAWRIIKDWLEAQLAIVATQMVAFDQVMLPYMSAGSNGRTVYDLYLEQQLALPAADGTVDAEVIEA